MLRSRRQQPLHQELVGAVRGERERHASDQARPEGIGPEEIQVILDDNPMKQGLFSPGHHIPVVPSSFLYQAQPPPDYALILAWNFAHSIIQKHQAFLDGGGHFILPLPTFRVV